MTSTADDTTTQEREPMHGAILEMSLHAFADLLDLPNGVHITGIFHNPLTAALIVHLTGDALPPVPESKPPAEAQLTVLTKRDHLGLTWRHGVFDVPHDTGK